MATITIDLPPELDRIVHEQVASGLYSDAGDVIREALRRLDAEEAATQLNYMQRSLLR
jgi:putative addiction module CopG family antidote